MPPNYITTIEAAERAGVTQRYMRQLCAEGKVRGAQMFGKAWMVPASFKWEPQRPGPKPKK